MVRPNDSVAALDGSDRVQSTADAGRRRLASEGFFVLEVIGRLRGTDGRECIRNMVNDISGR